MSDTFTIFVCSTFDDLEQEREGVLEAVRSVQQRHNAMEYFGARPGRPIETCLEEVRKSDLLVVVVGLKYGSLPPGLEISYSQAEYEEGARLKKPCLVYVRDNDVPILEKYYRAGRGQVEAAESVEGKSERRAHRRQVRGLAPARGPGRRGPQPFLARKTLRIAPDSDRRGQGRPRSAAARNL